MKKFLIAGNWKMNKTALESVKFAKELRAMDLDNEKDVAILAPFTNLFALADALDESDIGFGAQNVHFESSGAYTGEISVDMLKEIGVKYCIVGHSERREYFNETDETVNLKLKILISNEIIPILCVGESLETRESHKEREFVMKQLIRAFKGIDNVDANKIIIAYEPIWAIGTGKTATPQQAEEMCSFIRVVIEDLYSDNSIASNMLILYGGSMKPTNAAELLNKPNINGGLIGGASLKVEDFADIAKIASKILQ
ncbi:MAG: triose-phosphate isomerase [Clostridiales bacterium]|nr:triose-phosphate isomerase [Clostridiales bacterium]